MTPAGSGTHPTPRERVRAALQRRPVDRMPLTADVGASAGIGPACLDEFRRRSGADDPAEYFHYDIRVVEAPLTRTVPDFSRFHESVPAGTTFDEFGVGHVSSEAFPLGMETNPWRAFTTTRQIADYPFPVFHLAEPARRQIEACHERGYAVSVACGSINEWCYGLRGMGEFLVDLLDGSDLAEAALDRVEDLCTAMGTELERAGADVLCFYGDLGSQSSLLLGLSAWERCIKPRWLRILRAVRAAAPDAVLFYRSCGAVEALIPGLIEAGFDVLNPVQPECMDPVQIKKRYGSRLSLWGGIGMQSTMLTEDVQGVRRAVRSLVTEWERGGGAIVTLSQTVLPDVPWANVAALVQALREQAPVAG